MPVGLVVHGGAGTFDEDKRPKAVAACRTAVEAAWPRLQQGGSALDAVEDAVRSMESDPALNAGYGAVLNRDGFVELDAMIVEGRTLKFGAVAAVRRIEHPVSLARYVLERTPHHLLAGPGAEQFAQEQGVPLIDPERLIADYRRKARQKDKDTVGAVALDQNGNIAVAVSTGGISGKLPGRVGDSPVAGAGGYADNAVGAACATGLGEGIMRSLLTFRAVDLLDHGLNIQAAADEAMRIFAEKFDGDGGIIIIDKTGQVAIAHNTPTMPVAYMTGDGIFSQLTMPAR